MKKNAFIKVAAVIGLLAIVLGAVLPSLMSF